MTGNDNLCRLCPRRCAADRGTAEGRARSLCRAPREPKVALVSLHPWEEPCIARGPGAGTVFFSHCNLRCVFCQNHAISAGGFGVTVTVGRLAEIFLEQQARGASCLELVTATHYTDSAAAALALAKRRGLAIPVAWNSNGYELPETLALLDGLVDVWLPDLKYKGRRPGALYSGAPHYFEAASAAIRAMFAMAGPCRFDASGLMTRGVLIRHLALPWQTADSCACLDWILSEFGQDVWVSIMNQYVPMHKASRHPEINRRLTTLEYQRVIRHARAIGLRNAYVQERSSATQDFVPVFDGSRVKSA
ncbi:MAG: radical SAM protein [Duodenibacillus sp.]|nr:radical SAM protein [Duodenibacillus sp.]